MRGNMVKRILRVLGWIVLAVLALQLFFMLRIASMAVIDPTSTTVQRSEMLHSAEQGQWHWSQSWVPYASISNNLKRAVIASEDSDFLNHTGVEWEAIKAARQRNAAAQAKIQPKLDQIDQIAQRYQERAQKRIAELQKRGQPVDPQLQAIADGTQLAPEVPKAPTVKVYGGSTISQQLAKNLLLSGERTLLRKGQELLLTQYLELFLSKQRILEIYLNNVEWGQGVFGAEAAAHRYYSKSAAQLGGYEAAKLAVVLPRPRFFEQQVNSGYLNRRASTIAERMGGVAVP